MTDLLRGALGLVLIVLGVAVAAYELGRHLWLLALPAAFVVAVVGLLLLPPRRG